MPAEQVDLNEHDAQFFDQNLNEPVARPDLPAPIAANEAYEFV